MHNKVFKNNKLQLGIVLFIITTMFITACSNNETYRSINPKYGGTLHINLNGSPSLIFPGQVLKNSEQIITTQVYNGLIKYNARNLEIIPSIAKKWKIEREGTIYTFFLNSNVTFHNDACFSEGKGRKITAYDFKYAIEQICRSHIHSGHSLSKQVNNIIGFNAFLQAEQNKDTSEISGIVAFDDTTLVFRLENSDEMFIHYLAGTNALVFPKEAFEKYGVESTVGSGAFLLKNTKSINQRLILTYNENYFLKNNQKEQLPFIDSIRFSFITSSQQELLLFKKGNLDLILNLSETLVSNFLDEYIDMFQSNPPYYIMRQNLDYNKNIKYNVLRSNLQGIWINSQGFFDFSTLYFEQPKPQQIEIIN